MSNINTTKVSNLELIAKWQDFSSDMTDKYCFLCSYPNYGFGGQPEMRQVFNTNFPGFVFTGFYMGDIQSIHHQLTIIFFGMKKPEYDRVIQDTLKEELELITEKFEYCEKNIEEYAGEQIKKTKIDLENTLKNHKLTDYIK